MACIVKEERMRGCEVEFRQGLLRRSLGLGGGWVFDMYADLEFLREGGCPGCYW